MNKKGSVFHDLLAFFILGVLFLFVAASLDFMKVEVYDPASEVIKNQSLYFQNESSTIYQAMLDNDDYVDSVTLPFNLLFWFISFMAVGMSLYKAVNSRRTDIFSFLGKTTAGIIAFTYFLSVYLLVAMVWVIEQVWNPVFGDVIALYVPSFQYVLSYPFLIALIWMGVAIALNQLFGIDDS